MVNTSDFKIKDKRVQPGQVVRVGPVKGFCHHRGAVTEQFYFVPLRGGLAPRYVFDSEVEVEYDEQVEVPQQIMPGIDSMERQRLYIWQTKRVGELATEKTNEPS